MIIFKHLQLIQGVLIRSNKVMARRHIIHLMFLRHFLAYQDYSSRNVMDGLSFSLMEINWMIDRRISFESDIVMIIYDR